MSAEIPTSADAGRAQHNRRLRAHVVRAFAFNRLFRKSHLDGGHSTTSPHSRVLHVIEHLRLIGLPYLHEVGLLAYMDRFEEALEVSDQPWRRLNACE